MFVISEFHYNFTIKNVFDSCTNKQRVLRVKGQRLKMKVKVKISRDLFCLTYVAISVSVLSLSADLTEHYYDERAINFYVFCPALKLFFFLTKSVRLTQC